MLSQLKPHGDLWALNVSALPAFMDTELESTDQMAMKRLPKVRGSVAVIPVAGVLTKRGDWFGLGTEALGEVVTAASKEKHIGSIVLDVDSPGGAVSGLPEFADKVMAIRGRKPIIGVANHMAASAALWTITATDQVVVAPSGEIGSHGVFSMHVDAHRMYEQAGIDVTLISAGKHKTEGNMFEPLSDDARAEFQRSVNETFEDFTAHLAKSRKVTKGHVLDQFGQGRMFGGEEAKRRGIADRVETLSGVLSAMGGSRVINSTDSAAQAMLCDVMGGNAPELNRKSTEVAKARRHRERKRSVLTPN